jgi:predicted AAA+ superfamily ATPase
MLYLDQQFPQAEQITLVQDNLNTHHPGSFYTRLSPAKALSLSQRFEWLYTPTHASWLNMVELEFSALSRQCLNRRISSQKLLSSEVLAWAKHRNKFSITVNWQFSIRAARTKLNRHYKGVRT